MEGTGLSEKENSVLSKEERLKALLFPIEPYILTIERIIVWEKPLVSISLLIFINVFFWLSTTWRLFSLIGVTGFSLLFFEACWNFIHSQIESHNAESQADGWTELHQQLPGVPELARTVAVYWQRGQEFLEEVVCLRSNNKAKFFVYSIFTLSTLGTIGVYLPGVYIAYCTVMGLLLWPAACYHGITSKMSHIVQPITSSVEEKLNIKRRRLPKKGASRRSLTDETTPPGIDESDSDEGLDEFIPSTPSLIKSRTAQRGQLSADSESMHRERGSGFTSPLTSRDDDAEFDDHSCDQSDDDLLSDDYLPHFARGLAAEMPSVDDTLDAAPTHDLPVDEMPSFDNLDSTAERLKSSAMSFDPSHFREPSLSSEEGEMDALSSGLSFDEVSDALDVNAADVTSPTDQNATGVIGDIISLGRSTLLSAIATSPTVATIMSATSSGLTAARDKMSVVVKNAATASGFLTGEERKDEGDEDAAGDILDAEFEFLDQEELESLNP